MATTKTSKVTTRKKKATVKAATVTPVVASTTEELCDVTKVQVGSAFSRHSFGTVVEFLTDPNDGSPLAKLKNLAGEEWLITTDLLKKQFKFADQFDSEEKMSRTEVIEVLTSTSNTAMTVVFRKKVDPKIVAKLLEEGKGDKTARVWNKLVKDSVAGEESTIVGFHSGNFDEHQRLRFIKIGGDGGFRLVDPRTVESVIIARKKFTVK